jgi:hypothetical protein
MDTDCQGLKRSVFGIPAKNALYSKMEYVLITLILDHRRLALARDPMIQSGAKDPLETNPSSTDRKRVRARIAPDRSPAATDQR